MKPGPIGPPSKVGTVNFGWPMRPGPSPKHGWDVTAGVALVKAAGGFAQELDNSFLRFNNRPCILANLLAGGSCLAGEIVLLSNAAQRRNEDGQNCYLAAGPCCFGRVAYGVEAAFEETCNTGGSVGGRNERYRTNVSVKNG
jgi:hypothetical protein